MEAPVEMWLWLLLVMQPHNPKTQSILRGCGYDIRRACIQVRDGAVALTAREQKRARDVRLNEVRALQRQCGENDIYIIPFDSASYPEKLRYINNPPIVLFSRGDLRCLKNRKIISAVGTRNPSDYSLNIAHTLCASIAGTGAAVVSGLAVGLDAQAHRGALSVNGVTVGVLACGHLVDYPTASHDLKEDILRKGGAIISELLPETNVPQGYFNTRNRLISGIADAVVVLQAAARSGTLLTAAHAFEQRRRVFFIPPHDIMDTQYAGAAKLYADGASPVFGYEDIVNAFSITGETTSAAQSASNASVSSNAAPAPAVPPKDPVVVTAPPVPPASPKTKNAKSKKSAVKPAPDQTAAQSPQKAIPKGLGEDEMKVYKALMKESLDLDLIVVRTEIYYRTVMEILMEMEVNGLVERHPDGMYSIL